MTEAQKGIRYALIAYGAWGLFPIYWKFLQSVPALHILAHRVLWSFVFYLGFLLIKQKKTLSSLVQDFRTHAIWLLACGTMIGLNWGLYVWAVNAGHVLETSFGYFINPLINVAFGVIFLGEKLGRLQILALLLAFLGVLIQAVNVQLGFPWIALSLAISFGLYGLFKKRLPLTSFTGSTLETLWLLPLALGWLTLKSETALNFSLDIWLLLVLGGMVTALPLIWFSEAAKRLPLSTLGFFQYLAPSLQFLCAVVIFKEAFTTTHLVSFALTWSAIIVNLIALRRSWAR